MNTHSQEIVEGKLELMARQYRERIRRKRVVKGFKKGGKA